MPDATNIDFAGFFTNNLLVIPEYQRGFSWEERHLVDMWSDIEQLPEGKIHYYGSILTKRQLPDLRSAANLHVQKRDIIDGQQRCTSIFLLLLSIRDKLVQIDAMPDLILRLNTDFIYFLPHEGEAKLRLHNEHDDLNTFLRNLADGNAVVAVVAPERRILRAKAFFDQKIAEHTPEMLEDLFYKVTAKLHSTEVYLNEEMDEPTVFESINNRGLTLSPMDQLKNYIILITDRCDELDPDDIRFESHWFSALGHLMHHDLYQRKNENKMLAYYWIMHKEGVQGAEPSEAFENFKSKYEPLIRGGINDAERASKIYSLRSFVHGFTDFTQAFAEIESRSHTYSMWDASEASNISRSEARELHTKQDNIGHPDILLSVIVASYMKFDSQDFVLVLDALERTLFRVYRIVNRNSNYHRPQIAGLAHQIYQDTLNSGEVIEWLERFSSDESSLVQLRHRLEGLSDAYEWNGIVYLLHEFEGSLSGGMPVIPYSTFTGRSTSIEHILPQNPPEEGYWAERFSVEDRLLLTDNLGNLCLTENNAYYSNHDYPRKREGQDGDDPHCYLRASTHQEKKLAQDFPDDWDPDNLKEREAQLIDFACGRWKFDGEDD